MIFKLCHLDTIGSTAMKLFISFFGRILPKSVYEILKRKALIFLIKFGYSNSLERMDKMILELFEGMEGGFFIEVGAADGVDHSNTLLLEKKYNWKGLLIEARKSDYILCKKHRKNSIVENYILTSFEDKTANLQISQEGLKSRIIVDDEKRNYSDHFQNASYKEISTDTIPNTTLTEVLRKHSIDNVDIISLDVEGYERKVLEGYDEKTKIIKYLLVETNLEEFSSFAESRGWKYVGYMAGGTNPNYLFKLR